MKVFSLPDTAVYAAQAILFDMDSTLYTHAEYAQTQLDLPVTRLAQVKGKSYEQMKTEVAEYRKNWAATHNGQKISLGNVFLSFGVSIDETIRWREELYQPEKYLTTDKQLRSALERLAARFTFAVVTNNPVSVAVRTLSVLGVHDLLRIIVGLDTCHVSKPNKTPLYKAAELCGVTVQQCISVGDRYDIDIALPLELGMGGVLVDGVRDVYKLPDLFT
jgi:phosphoglycolate phosphatase/putative hydrolase of the HAD superfamily